MLAIVLSGGGAKGSYEIGVWKALKKLKIKYDIVTGTSVGALNGSMMVTGEYKKAVKIWENINYSQVVDNGTFNNKNDYYKYYLKNVIKGGAHISSLEKLVDMAVDENKFFKSKIDFGLVTFNFRKLEEKIVTKKDMKKGDLKNYIIASASCYPFFQKKTINNTKYVDGGYYDNLPINLALSLGADEIIAVDLKAIGIKRKIKDKKAHITYITPHNDIGELLDFKQDVARRNIRYGFNDTMKVFKKLDGTRFTFKKNQLNKIYEQYKDKYYELLLLLFPKQNDKVKEGLSFFTKLVEKVGILFELDESLIYTKKTFNKKIKEKLSKIKDIDYNSKVKKVLSLFNKKEIVKFFYKTINVDNKRLSNYDLFMNEEVQMAIYLYVIQ